MSMSDRVVLFRDGRIVQQGSPREVYERPESVWAANFLGAANVWPVSRVRGWAGSELTVVSEGFEFTFEPASGEPVAGSTSVISRPEDTVLTASAAPGVRCYPGVVTAVEYLGTSQNVTLALEGGPLMNALVSGRGERYEIGQAVQCHWRPGSHSVVPAD